MVCCKDYATQISERAFAQKKISKPDVYRTNNEDVENILKFIDYVNAQPEFTAQLWDGRRFEDIIILDEFKDFVLPDSVRLDALDRRFPDLLVRGDAKKMENPFDSYLDYIDTCDTFRGMFKRDANSDVVTLSSLRAAKNLMDVIHTVSVKDRVNSDPIPYVPMELNGVEGIVGKRYLNDTSERMMKDYIARINFIK